MKGPRRICSMDLSRCLATKLGKVAMLPEMGPSCKGKAAWKLTCDTRRRSSESGTRRPCSFLLGESRSPYSLELHTVAVVKVPKQDSPQ